MADKPQMDTTLHQLIALEASAAQEHMLAQLRDCNRITLRYGLSLSWEGMLRLAERREAALQSTGRVEMEGGILPKLIYTFCDSPYMDATGYEDTIAELQDMFYQFKNETQQRLSDDELLAAMTYVLHGEAQGSLEYLADLQAEDLHRAARQSEAFAFHIDPTSTTRPITYDEEAPPLSELQAGYEPFYEEDVYGYED